MIIDNHVHLMDVGWHQRHVYVGMAKQVTAMAGKDTGEYPDANAIVDNLMPVLPDPTGEKTVAGMDAAGVDVSCIFAHDTGLLAGEPEVPVEEQNRLVAEAAKRFPDRFVPFFSIDPRREGALDLFSRAVEEWGMRGLKFHPASGFFPFDEVCYPFYEKCMEYRIPHIVHTGQQAAPLKFRFSQPINVDDVAADFPDLPIIMAHVGHAMWERALQVATVKANVYFDFSGWQFVLNNRPAEFYRMLRRLLDEIGPWRVFFGSDGPYLNVVCPLDTWVKAVKEPDLSSCPEVSFTDEEIDIIMGRAFARLTGMEER